MSAVNSTEIKGNQSYNHAMMCVVKFRFRPIQRWVNHQNPTFSRWYKLIWSWASNSRNFFQNRNFWNLHQPNYWNLEGTSTIQNVTSLSKQSPKYSYKKSAFFSEKYTNFEHFQLIMPKYTQDLNVTKWGNKNWRGCKYNKILLKFCKLKNFTQNDFSL